MSGIQPPLHGGRLHAAAEEFNIPLSDWLDLSTGINPFAWQPPAVPQYVWQCLPDSYTALESAAQQFYSAPMLAIPGSQWAIQHIPTVIASNRVWLPRESYEEHRYWWQYHNHNVQPYDALGTINLMAQDVVVVINPNNPTTHVESAESLLQIAEQLHTLSGHLVIDEAFMDCTPQESVFNIGLPLPENMLVLRSLGKFFGLAGLRLGFLYCRGSLHSQITQKLGPWAVSHPASYLGELALLDTDWHKCMRRQLQQAALELQTLLMQKFDSATVHSTNLFSTVQLNSDTALDFCQHCARRGILIRHFEQWNKIRVGLTTQNGMERLKIALKCWNF